MLKTGVTKHALKNTTTLFVKKKLSKSEVSEK